MTGDDSLYPDDIYNQKLLNNVHPPHWINPEPASKYNLVVIGAGTAGLVSAAGAAGLGAKVALVERAFLGGDCLNYGCVPSKAILRSSRAMKEIMELDVFGLEPVDVLPDFGRVMERMRRLRSKISKNDSAERLKSIGVDVFIGGGVFSGPDTVMVGDSKLCFKKAVIATGARPFVPPIKGLENAGYITNETVFSLTERPNRLTVIGGGPIGCELAQAFGRLGSKVTIMQDDPTFLPREDPDATGILSESFRTEGIRVILNARIQSVITSPDGSKMIEVESDNVSERIIADAILVGAGRMPNVEGLGLETAGVAFDTRTGVTVNDHLRTTNKRIYAAGDVCLRYKFTHTADASARIVIRNALFGGRARFSSLSIPWCTFTDPEIAHVGIYERDAEAAGIPVDTFIRQFEDVDRAILDSEDKGFVKIHVKKGTDIILGATIVAKHAGDMISEISVAMAGKVGLGSLGNIIHPYPTQAEAIKQLGDAYNRSKLTPFVSSLFKKWLTFTR